MSAITEAGNAGFETMEGLKTLTVAEFAAFAAMAGLTFAELLMRVFPD